MLGCAISSLISQVHQMVWAFVDKVLLGQSHVYASFWLLLC
jgi:hypothetical protein